MPSFFASVAVPALALAGSTFANPLKRGDDACLAAVTGKAALGDNNLRSSHCASYLKTIVTPPAITVTTTITDAPEPTGWGNYKRAVTVCPNEVPNYASACDDAGYKSACSVWGITSETTFTIPATTTTETVYQNGGKCTDGTATVTSTVTLTGTPSGGFPGSFSGSVVTSTVTASASTVTVGASTVTVGASTVTVTGPASGVPTGGPGNYSGKCISQSHADTLVSNFIDLLEYTNYPGNNATHTPAGRGYHQNVSDVTLATTFEDYSDSINWMAGFPLGGVTFASKAAFDYGQGNLQPEVSVETLNTWYGCNTITWRYRLTTPSQASVQGINQFVVDADTGLITTNYAEFDNGAWLYSFGLNCKVPASTKRSIRH